MTEKSPHLRAHAAFAGRLELLPLADERVVSFQETPDGNIAVAYKGKRTTRVMLITKVAGEWVVVTKAIVPLENVPAPPPAKFDHEPFHFTKDPMTAQVPLTHQQKALRYYNLLGW
jgi:hypothetical protein